MALSSAAAGIRRKTSLTISAAKSHAELETAGARIVSHLLENAPDALKQTKAHVLAAAFADLDEAAFAALVAAHAAKRQTAEAAEGLASFAEKRAARWA
jgi:methylglutaconyl-CoA hydratase